jgi:large subunit ribosomal protein L23
MSLLDSFKRKKKDVASAKSGTEKAAPEKTETIRETVVTPEGKMVAVEKKVTAKSAKEKEKEKKTVKPKIENTAQAYHVLLHPLVSEKGSFLAMHNQYAFAVHPDTNKIEIRKAIKAVYGVDPTDVNIMNVSGKWIRYGRNEGRTKNWKKAIVTLPEGQKIDIQEGL